MKRFYTACVAIAACAALAPASALAQLDSCNTSIETRLLQSGPFDVGQTVPIQLELIADDIEGGNHLDISEFSVFLDCTEGDLWPTCTMAGNTVTFEGVSSTTCTDATPAASTFLIQEGGGEVIFNPEPDGSGVVRIPANSSCTVDFDVRVDAIADTNTDREIVELLGFADINAVCDNGVDGGNAGSISFGINADVTIFRVSKIFSDANPGEVDIQLICTAGNNLVQPFALEHEEHVEFQIAGFTPGNMNCSVSEEPFPGYTPNYAASADDGIAADIYDDGDGCYYDGVEGGRFLCDIANELDPVPYVVNKRFLYDDEEGIGKWAGIDVYCQNYRNGAYGDIVSEGGESYYVFDDDEAVFWIYPNWDEPTTRCRALEENMIDAVESDQGCSDWIELFIEGDGECTILNTVFYEGIPTMNQKGLALMILLMMGVGALGIRRLV